MSVLTHHTVGGASIDSAYIVGGASTVTAYTVGGASTISAYTVGGASTISALSIQPFCDELSPVVTVLLDIINSGNIFSFSPKLNNNQLQSVVLQSILLFIIC